MSDVSHYQSADINKHLPLPWLVLVVRSGLLSQQSKQFLPNFAESGNQWNKSIFKYLSEIQENLLYIIE